MNTEELPLFPLARWELPPHLASEPLIAPATARWHGESWGETTNWLVRVVWEEDYGHVFICAEERVGGAKWDLWTMRLKVMENPEEWAAIINNHVQMWGIYHHRIFYISDEIADWSLVLNIYDPNQIVLDCLNKLTGEPIDGMASFEVNWPFNFPSADAAQIESELLTAWNDETSDLFYARGWLLLTQEEKYARLIHWKRGDEHEFKAMMEIVWRALVASGDEKSSQWAFRPYANKFGFAEWDGNDWYNGLEQPVAFEPWGEALVTWFGPCWNQELINQHLCADYGSSRANNHFWIGACARTHHEQLEAARTLSDWLDEREARGGLEADTLAALRETLR